jgi:antitoxin ParD1/3/4
MNVSLTPELEQFVAGKVDAGRYNSASEVVREALRLLEERDENRAVQLASFQREIELRLQSLDRGEHVDPADVRAWISEKSRARRQAGG